MSRPATRILAFLEVLQDRGLVSADELAARLNVDARSVRRYLTALRDLGIPVESVRGRYGGYRLAPGYRLPPLMLSDDEAVAVAVALAAADAPDTIAEPSAADRALIKLNRLLPAALRTRVTALAAATSVLADGRRPAAPDPGVALTLAAAVRAGRRVRIEHTRHDREQTTRDVDPHGLVVYARRWYLVGHDQLRRAMRMYRVDRISRATELPQRAAAPPHGFDPVEHVRHALTFGLWAHRSEIWLDTDAATARRHLPALAGELHPCPAGGVLLEMGVQDIPGAARFLASLPWRFVIHHPHALAEALEAHVTTLTAAITHAQARTTRTAAPNS